METKKMLNVNEGLMLGDILENLRVDELRSGIGMPGFGKGLNSDHPILLAGPPTNQQIIDATREFYGKNQDLVDTTTNNTHSASQNQGFVRSLNALDWKSQVLTKGMREQTSVAIFNDANGGNGSMQGHTAATVKDCVLTDPLCQGIFGPALCKVKASQMFNVMSVGVNAEAIIFVGGMGGLGCLFDFVKREGPRGYGFATAELGLKIAIDFNVQACMFNVLPSRLSMNIFGLSVGVYTFGGASFYMFFDATNINNLTILGFSVGVGLGLGGGAAVFGGHIWNFG
jgi:hypothetical protein